MLSDVKGLSLAKGGSTEPFKLPWIRPCIVLHNNSVYKKS